MILRFLITLRAALLAPTPVVSWVVLSIIFAASGPFGTDILLAFLPRLAFWVAVVGAAIFVGITIRVSILQMRPETGSMQLSVAAALIAGLILSAVVPPLWQWMIVANNSQLLSHGPGSAQVAVIVSMLGIGMGVLRLLLVRREGAEPVSDVSPSRLLARLPENMAGEILHLCGSDHYVEVATSRGSGKVLMRFCDVLDEVAQLDGLQVHRSHWVARSAILGIEEERGRLFLVLVTGRSAPVSRAYREAVDNLHLKPMEKPRRAASARQ